jgi:engulfment/cell motility protein 1
MMLINSLLSHVTDARWEEFISDLERLNVRKAVVVGSHASHPRLESLSSIPAPNVATYGRRSNIMHPGLPSKYCARHISEKDHCC